MKNAGLPIRSLTIPIHGTLSTLQTGIEFLKILKSSFLDISAAQLHDGSLAYQFKNYSFLISIGQS
jgi:hypothetical protein